MTSYSMHFMCFQTSYIYKWNHIMWAALVAQTVKNLPAMRETGVGSLGQEDPLKKGMLPTPVLLPGEFHRQRSLVVYSPWGHKESDRTERLIHTYVILSILMQECIQIIFLRCIHIDLCKLATFKLLYWIPW